MRAEKEGVNGPAQQFLSFEEAIEKIGIGHVVTDHDQIDIAFAGLFAFGDRAVHERRFDAVGMRRERLA